MSLTAAAAFLAVLALPCLYAIWFDLRELRIPNPVVILCLALFLIVSPFVLDGHDILVRLGIGLAVFAAGFLLYLTGRFGAGDAKFAAVLVPFVSPGDLPIFMIIYSLNALAAVVVVRGLLWLAPGVARRSGWRSLSGGREFPLGVAIAGAILFYLGAVIRFHLIR